MRIKWDKASHLVAHPKSLRNVSYELLILLMLNEHFWSMGATISGNQEYWLLGFFTIGWIWKKIVNPKPGCSETL